MNIENMTSTRERYLDISKGIGIWSIVLLHFENGFFPSWLNVFISSFMITIFYVVAGFIVAEKTPVRTPKQFFKRRLKQLGIPYLWWSGVIIVFDSLLWALHYYDGYFIAREIYKTLILSGVGTLWFLSALFFGEIAWYYMKEKQAFFIIMFLVVMVVYRFTYSNLFDGHTGIAYKLIRTPFISLDKACGATFYIAFGYYYYKIFGTWLKKADSLKLLIYAMILWVVTYYTACHLHSIVGKADSYLWSYLAPVIGPIALLFTAKALENTRYMRVFEYWGVNSLCLMLVHYSFVLVLCCVIDKYILGVDSYYGARTLVYFMISMPVLYWITLLINAKARFLLGK